MELVNRVRPKIDLPCVANNIQRNPFGRSIRIEWFLLLTGRSCRGALFLHRRWYLLIRHGTLLSPHPVALGPACAAESSAARRKHHLGRGPWSRSRERLWSYQMTARNNLPVPGPGPRDSHQRTGLGYL